jgi:N-acetylglucosamine-6-sulfatase
VDRGAVLRPLAAAVAVSSLVTVAWAGRTPAPRPVRPPNVLLVVTDDQTIDSLPSDPASMPWLQTQLADPSAGWLWFPQAVVSTPMCCPSRASILTGLDAAHTGVGGNLDGDTFDESQTLAVWLHDAGYRTGLVGKYLNGYPFGRGPYVPPGWDRWFAKTNQAERTVYEGFTVVDQTSFRRVGTTPADYATDVLGREAVDFVRGAPAAQPWFLMFTPSAPHAPWIPAPRDVGRFADVRLPAPSDAVLNDVAGKPSWVRELAPIDAPRLAALQADRLAERETLLDVDRWLQELVEVVASRGELDRTVIVFLSDNGYAFGEHRWQGKAAPYEPSIRVPLAIRSPWTPGRTVGDLVANLDVAPTIADLAGVRLPWASDGLSLAPLVRGSPAAPGLGPGRTVPLRWEGDAQVPAWDGVRTAGALCVRYEDGSTEAYDLVRDPDELRNLAGPGGFGVPGCRVGTSLSATGGAG